MYVCMYWCCVFKGTSYLTGAIVSFAMLIIYTAASDEVRRTKYEIFFNAHHFFTVFFVVMFLHGVSEWLGVCMVITMPVAAGYSWSYVCMYVCQIFFH